MTLSAGALFYGAVAELVDTGFFVISFRLAPLMVFPLCALGAIGMDALLTEPRRLPPWVSTAVRIVFTALVALAFLSLMSDYATMREGLRISGPLQYLYFIALLTACAVLTLAGIRGSGSGSALALIVAQLASLAPLAATYNPIIDARLLYPTPPAVARLQDEAIRAPSRVLMAPNMAMLYGLYGVAGYDGMTPRYLEEVVRPTQSQLNFVGSGYLAEVPIFLSPVRDLLGVRHILVPPNVALDGPGLSLQYLAADGRIYRSETALPRTFVVSHARCLGDEQALHLIRERAVDFRREVLLAGCASAPLASDGPSNATAVIEHYAPHRVVISAASDHPGYLVLTDTWFPGWTAHVDGRESPVERADYAFRAVRLEPGRHEVVFLYDPGSVRLGLALSVLALLAIVAFGWWPRRRPNPADEAR